MILLQNQWNGMLSNSMKFTHWCGTHFVIVKLYATSQKNQGYNKTLVWFNAGRWKLGADVAFSYIAFCRRISLVVTKARHIVI